jgi:hypothetical protein
MAVACPKILAVKQVRNDIANMVEAINKIKAKVKLNLMQCNYFLILWITIEINVRNSIQRYFGTGNMCFSSHLSNGRHF